MTKLEPVVSWYEGTNTKSTEVVSKISYGVVDADTTSATKTFFIVNNRGGTEDCPKMEDVTFTTRDLNGGLGDTVGNIVEAVKDNWFQTRCDSLGESAFVPVGKGGVGTPNPSGVKALGTNGTTINVNAATATIWGAEATLSLNTYIKPTVDNGFIYKVTTAGITGLTEPVWLTTEGLITQDGTAVLTAYKINNKPEANALLGLANNMADDGSNASDAGGNFTQISVLAEVPITAKSGKNTLNYRVSYRFV